MSDYDDESDEVFVLFWYFEEERSLFLLIYQLEIYRLVNCPQEMDSSTGEPILDFFNTAQSDELATLNGCSKKKADLLITLRPFESWDDLVRKKGCCISKRDSVCSPFRHSRGYSSWLIEESLFKNS